MNLCCCKFCNLPTYSSIYKKMEKKEQNSSRRSFIKNASLLTMGTSSLLAFPLGKPTTIVTQETDINIIGPKEGYSPQIGTLVSMMTWMRMVILAPVHNMSVTDLDYLVDDNANSIGAMLMHLAATERFYQIHTFNDKTWGDWPKEDTKRWSVASGLGDRARKKIKGNELSYYLDALDEVRQNTLKEFANRDDKWLLKVDEAFPWGPTNNYCKWFHVCEHESNHNGQFKFIKSRLPS